MSVEYTVRSHEKSRGEFFNKTFNECYDYFKNRHSVTILGEGIKDILGEDSLFEEYTEKLTEGLSATDASDMNMLMENARTNILLESSTSGVAPVAALTFPSLRVMWARTGLIRAVPTEVVRSNSFAVSYNRPFIITEEGEKMYLPEALDRDKNIGDKKRLQQTAYTLPLKNHDLLADVGCSKATGDSIDRNFRLASCKIGGEDVIIDTVKGKLDINNRIYVEVATADGATTDIIFASVDLWHGTCNIVSMSNNVTEVKIAGFVASDAHNHSTNISFEMERRDCTIGTGEHFEASLPIEFLQDVMATYNVDGTSEVTDIMTNIIAQKLDMELFDFIQTVYDSTGDKFYGEFDMRPSGSYALNPKEWREELKTQIDILASSIMKETHLYQGYFVIMGSPVDMQILPNVNWTFSKAVDNQGGVEVNYSLGAMSGANRYMLVSSDLIPDGDMYLLFVPTIPNYMSVKYYPYTFNVTDKYLNTRVQNVPSLTMTKRQTIEVFAPLVMKIKILNNNVNMLKNLPR